MGTVLVDRYRVVCQRCNYDAEFMIGGGMGDYEAVKRARGLHQFNAADQRQCPDADEIVVMKL